MWEGSIMEAVTPAWSDTLNSARMAITNGRAKFEQAARNIAQGADDCRLGDSGPGQPLVDDLLDLSRAAFQIKAGVALVRADRETGDEILSMVRHDRNARAARDTRPDHRFRLHRELDLLV
jgi:hypothetical protein